MRRAALLACLLASRIASADRITVRVVEMAGDTAYVTPGRNAGLVPGTKVHFGGRDLVVVEASDKNAAVAFDRTPLTLGQTGTADVTPGQHNNGERLPTPKPLEDFKEQWPAAERPADQQQVTPVPLGEHAATANNRLALLGNLFGNLDPAGSGGQAELRGVGTFNSIHDSPLGADVDASLRFYDVGWNSHERTPLFVRAAQLRWGDQNDPSLLFGRLRYAATSLGMLDGGRAAYHTGNLELAAFGGLVPDPVSGHPTTDASMFGAEMIYDDANGAWQPRLAVTAHGSTWQGQMDERVLQVSASAHKGATLLDAWADVQNFDSNNPWGAPTIDLTGAGATAEWRDHGDHLGVDLTFMRPERSLRLAAALPPDWLCARAAKPGNVMEQCLGNDYWAAATASAGLRRSWGSIDAVGSVGQTQSVTVGYDASGYVRAELGSHELRAVIAPAIGHDSFGAWVASDFGVAASLSAHLDADLTYRPESLDYVAATGAYFLNSLVTDVRWAASPTTDFALSAVGTVGHDGNVLALLTTIAWRPPL